MKQPEEQCVSLFHLKLSILQPLTFWAFVKWTEGFSLGLCAYRGRDEILTQNVHILQNNRSNPIFCPLPVGGPESPSFCSSLTSTFAYTFGHSSVYLILLFTSAF